MSNLSRLPGGEYVETVNNAVQGYEPGSVVKPLSMMVALDDGVIRPHDVVNGHDGVFRYPAGMKVRPITDTHGRASMTATEAMKYSSNIGLSDMNVIPMNLYSAFISRVLWNRSIFAYRGRPVLRYDI